MYFSCTSYRLHAFAAWCAMYKRIRKLIFPARTSHHIDSVVGLPLVVNFCIKKTSEQQAGENMSRNQPGPCDSTKHNQDFCLIPDHIRNPNPNKTTSADSTLQLYSGGHKTGFAAALVAARYTVHCQCQNGVKCQDVRTTGKGHAPLTWQLLT